MNIVVDTNIVFSALMSPAGNVSDILMNSASPIQFFSPKFLEFELEKYEEKILKYSGITRNELQELKRMITPKIYFIDHDLIQQNTWNQAKTLTQDIDEKDAPFVALTIELNALLWTGDKKLIKGLKRKSVDWAIDSEEMRNLMP